MILNDVPFAMAVSRAAVTMSAPSSMVFDHGKMFWVAAIGLENCFNFMVSVYTLTGLQRMRGVKHIEEWGIVVIRWHCKI